MHSTGIIKIFLIELLKRRCLLTPYLSDQSIYIQALFHNAFLKKKKKKSTWEEFWSFEIFTNRKSFESLGQFFWKRAEKTLEKALNFAIVISIFMVTRQNFGHGHSEGVV